VDFEYVAETIELSDNSGRSRVVFRPRGLSDGSIIADVTITIESVEDERGSGLNLTAFPISHTNLIRLDELLVGWLADQREFDIDIAQEHWARFAITVGPEPDYISSKERPAFRIDTTWCGVAAVAMLVVDQSCMRLFHEGLAGWLRLARATG
jgi:hypothetical protein